MKGILGICFETDLNSLDYSLTSVYPCEVCLELCSWRVLLCFPIGNEAVSNCKEQ